MSNLLDKVGMTNEDLIKIYSMRPGRHLDLQFSTSTTTKRVRTEFVGMDGKRCMIFRYPNEVKWGPLGDGIFKDKTMIVRYILEDDIGEIIAFKVKIILVSTKPSHLIFTSFPLIIQKHDLRAEPRTKTRIAASIIDAQSDLVICNSKVIDISVNGCRLSTDKSVSEFRPKVEQIVKMRIDTPKDKQNFLTGTIMNRHSDEVNLYYGIKYETPLVDLNQFLQDLMLVTG
jgi:hypothetical protein